MRKRLFTCNLFKQGTVKHSLFFQIVTTDNWFQGVSFVILDCTTFYEMRFCFAKQGAWEAFDEKYIFFQFNLRNWLICSQKGGFTLGPTSKVCLSGPRI